MIGALLALSAAAHAAQAAHEAAVKDSRTVQDSHAKMRVSAGRGAQQLADWSEVEQVLESFHNLTDCPGCNCPGCSGFTFTAGDATGRKFLFEKGVKASKLLPMASASKFPAAIAIAGAVADGHLTFDTRAGDVFSWWSSSDADPRSKVTLRQLLSFTSPHDLPT